MPEQDPWLVAAVIEFTRSRQYCERAFAQLRDEDLFVRLNAEQCSIATYVRHMAGNMRSRWTDFLTSDGEKPGRDREREFEEAPVARADVQSAWDEGWTTLFAALGSLRDEDLRRTVTIRREAMTVPQAILRQVAHYAWHAGQIVLIAKHIKAARGEAWEYMTIAPRASAAFNRSKGM